MYVCVCVYIYIYIYIQLPTDRAKYSALNNAIIKTDNSRFSNQASDKETLRVINTNKRKTIIFPTDPAPQRAQPCDVRLRPTSDKEQAIKDHKVHEAFTDTTYESLSLSLSPYMYVYIYIYTYIYV